MEQNNGYPVTIHLGARNLKNLNSVYLSDPVCKVYLKNEVIGSTEVQKKNLSPDWKETIEINYVFNEHQKLRFEIYDANSGIVGQLTQLAIGGEKKSLIGTCSSTLAALVGAPKSLSKLEIRFEHEVTGYLIVFINVGRAQRKKERKIKQIQQIQQIQQQVVVQQEEPEKVEYIKEDTKIIWKWGGLKLLDLDFFSKSDPFAMFYKFIEGNAKILIHQTPVRKNDLNPIWEVWETTEEDLCQFSKQIFVEVWDYDKVGGHDLIGNVTINYDEIKYGQKDFQLLTLKGKKAGTLKLLELTIIDPPPPPQPQIQPEPQQTQEIIQQEVEYEQEVDPEPEPPREPTFLDYLVGGWQLSMQIGIDFTFSNQPISKPDSLHFITPGQLNYYQKAIKYIGGTVIAFDHDKYVPVYGFGGTPKLPTYKKKTMDDCFPLNGNKDDPYCEDIPGILRAYEEAVPLIEFSGPTFVANILREGLKVATENAQSGIYTVCLILTDGQIEDLDDTIKIIVDCSKLPMSIIFIGVGDENFKYMKQLDDTNFLKKQSKSQVDIRDIVQFVSYQEFKNDISLMSAKVLENLPKQFMDYMHLHNILPMKSQSVFKMSQAYK